MQKNTDFMPIILGSDENAYGMARAFHERYGIVSTVLCKYALVPTRYSKIMQMYYFADLDTPAVFLDSLLSVAKEKKQQYQNLLLIPCSDRYLELVTQNREAIAAYFCNRFISNELLQRFVNKESFYAICEEYGLAYPKTVICDYDSRLTILDSSPLRFPIVVKANNSNSYEFMSSRFAGKQKVFFVKSKEEYTSIIQNMNQSNYTDNLILQEFVPGGDSAMRVLNCYSDNNGKVRLMCLGKPLLEEYEPLALGNYAAIMTDYDAGVFAQIKQFLEDIHYTGFSNFDMKFDPVSGQYKVFEINPRQGRSSFFVTAAGYNLAEVLVENAVYGKQEAPVYANVPWLWLSIPKRVLYRYTEDPHALKQARELIRQKKYTYTLRYKKDRGLLRVLRMWLYYYRQNALYKQYFFKKTELAAQKEQN